MKPVKIVTHSEDIDGLAAQAMLRRLYRDQGVPVAAGSLVTSTELRAELLTRTRDEVGRVVVADLALGESVLSDSELIAFAGAHELVVHDHHDVGAHRADLLARVCHEGGLVPGTCSARLVQAAHFPDDPGFALLADACQATDFSVMGSAFWLGSKLNALIAHSDAAGLDRLADDLADGRVLTEGELSPEYRAAWDVASARDTAALAEMRAHSRLVDCGGIGVAVGSVPRYVSTKLALGALAFTGPGRPDIGCLAWLGTPHVHVVAYLRDLPADLAGFCRAHGGGGRDNAGGFPYRTVITADNVAEAIEWTTHELGDWLDAARRGASVGAPANSGGDQ